MRIEPEPVEFAIHPAVFGTCCLISAAMWLGSFKLMAALCRAAASVMGVGQ
ncbi:hypothetical protein [Sphingobium sp. YBL2]|uniref:hypothetical protein n=1 Tax=Sphingobium sp. (strain YBL2) TaxID=484429 RepID=UPI000AA51632|nr:hypothetical protein [Sphingobium sp. YBL2]